MIVGASKIRCLDAAGAQVQVPETYLTALLEGLTPDLVITSTSATYTVQDANPSYDKVIVNTYSAGVKTIDLPASPQTGRKVTVKDGAGIAATHNLTISGNGKNIDGAATDTITANYQSQDYLYNGTQWNKV